MKKLLLLFLITVRALAQIQPEQPSQGLFNGNIFANGYANWSVPMGLNASFSWTATSFCTANSGGTSFPAFTVGTPITILDQNNPQLNEVVTVTQVNTFATGCSISTTPPARQHSAFSLTTATAGLQEAINANLSTPVPTTVHLTADWYKAGGNLTMVTATAKGNTNIGIIDDTTTPTNAYSWNGSHYVLTAIAGVSLATYNVPGLQGGGRCFVYPSQITTDAFALINNCSSQLPAAGGLIDATALGTANYTVTTQLTALNNAHQAVSLLLNEGTTFTINTRFDTPTNSPASCAVPVGPAVQPNGGSSIIVPGKNTFNGNFILGPSARVWDAVCNGDFTGNQETLKLDGVTVQGNQSATMMGALVHLAGVFTPTSIINSGTINCFGQCLEIDAGTTGTGGPAIGDLLFLNDLFQDTYSGSATYPGSVVRIDSLAAQAGAGNINFFGGMIQLNGPHNPLLVINGNGGVQTGSIGFFGTTFQGAAASTSGSNPNVDPIQLTDVSSVLITNLKYAGSNNNSQQQNLVDIFGTIQNAQFGINLNQITAFTGVFQCLIKNNVEGTCESGYPSGNGDTALPNYTYGQFFPQIRQTNVAPPTTPGQCVVGSIWTNSSATTAANSALICAGTPGNQVYVSFGGGGGGGGGLGTLQNDLVGNNSGNTGAIDLLNFFSSSTYTEQQAVNAAFTNVGVATLMPKAIPVPFTNLNNASVVDLEHPAARTSSVDNFGAQCNARTVFLTFSAASTTITIHNDFFYLADVGKTIAAVGSVGGIPTAYEAKITSIGAGPTSTTATVDTTTPFAQASQAPSPLGTDDTTTIQQAFTQAKTPPPGTAGYLSATALTFPASSCLTHQINYTGVSFSGLDPVKSQWIGFPGENILLAPDPSSATPAPGNGVHIHDITANVDNRIDATLPWQIVNASGTTSKTAIYQPTGILSATANNPLGPGWMQGALANFRGAIAGVCAINSGSPTLCTVPAGLTLPVATNVMVFPYLSSVFTTTVSSVNTGTRVVTLAGSYPGSTGTQIGWFAGTSVQKLGASYSGSGCPTTMTLTNPITPSTYTESNVAPFGLIQVDSEQFTYFGKTNAGNLGSQFLTIAGCAQNGTSRAAHGSSATVVPLNPFKPATPWPVTPTVNAGLATPLNAAFYPAWNVGNAFFSAPVANGATGSFGVDSFANALVENITVNSYPTSDPFNHNAAMYLVSLPYSTKFRNIVAAQTFFGIEEGVPSFNSGAGWAAAQPTADGTSWDGIRISSCNVMDMVAGNQNSYKDFNVYSQCENSSGTGVGAQTSYYFTFGWNDQTGAPLSATTHTQFINMYVEHENGALNGLVPGMEIDCFTCRHDDMHVGSGTETRLGGGAQWWNGGNFNTTAFFPVLNYGQGNGSDGTQLLFIGAGVGNTYGTNALINYAANAGFSGATSNPSATTAPYGPNQFLNSREPWHGQSNKTFDRGNTTAPFVDSNGGYIPASEFNTNGMFEAQPFTVQWYYDPASFSGGSVGCNVGTGVVSCLAFKWNQIGIQVGPGQRIVDGKYTLYIQSKSTGAAGSYQLQVGVCTPNDVAAFTIPVTSSYSWSAVQVDLTGKGGCAGSIGLGFASANVADTVSVGAVDFAPVGQQPTDYNLQLLNQLLDSAGSPGTSGFVWTSQGTGSPSHWAASSGGISGGVNNTMPKFTGTNSLGLSLWTDNGTTATYTGTGGLAITSTLPGKMILSAGSGSLPALPSNAFGFAAPDTGGTSYLFKPPPTITAGAVFTAAPATHDGVSESAITVQNIGYYATANGMKCDNSTNDSTALQTLINTVSSSGTQGGTIILPPGTTCLMGSTKITLPLNVIIAGQGAASSQLSWTGGTALIVVGSPTPGQMTLNGQNVINHAGLKDLTVNGPSATGSSICLFLGGDPAGVISTSTNFAPYVVFQNVTIDNCGVGTELGNNSYIAEFHNVRWTFNGQHWVDLATNSNAGERMAISASAFILAQSTTAPALALNGTDSEYDISDTSFDFNGTASAAPDINTSASSAYLRFNCTGCHFEKTTVNGGSGFVSQTGTGKASFRFNQSSFSDDASSGTIACMLCNATSGGTTNWSVKDSDVIPGGTTTAFLSLGSNASQVMVQSLSYAPFGGAPAAGVTGSTLTHLCIQNTIGLTSVNTGC